MSRMEEIINRALITKKAKVISSVYETEDYSIFKELENNRAYHHRDNKHGVHGNAELDLWFKQLAQNCFEIVHGHDKWMEIFHRNYL